MVYYDDVLMISILFFLLFHAIDTRISITVEHGELGRTMGGHDV